MIMLVTMPASRMVSTRLQDFRVLTVIAPIQVLIHTLVVVGSALAWASELEACSECVRQSVWDMEWVAMVWVVSDIHLILCMDTAHLDMIRSIMDMALDPECTATIVLGMVVMADTEGMAMDTIHGLIQVLLLS